MDALGFFMCLIGLAYSALVLAVELRRGKVNTRLLAHTFFILGIYGQGLRLLALGQYTTTLNEPILLFMIGHFAFETGYFVIGRSMKMSVTPTLMWIPELQFKTWQYRQIVVASVVISFVSLIAWYLFFLPYGGAIAYMYEGLIDERVLLSAGHGIELIIIQFFPLANYLLFTLLIIRKRCGFQIRWIALIFVSHTIVMAALWLPLGSRGVIAVSVIWYIMLYQIWSQKKIKLASIMIIGVVLLLVLAFLGELREKKSIESYGKGVVATVEATIKDGWGYSGRLWSYADTILLVPDVVPYQYGATYAVFFTQFIPRKFYPDKPLVGAVIITKARATDYSGRSNDQLSMIGEAFLNFGVVGVLVVPLIIGAFARIVNNRLRQRRYLFSPMITITLMFMLFFLIQGDFVNATVNGSMQIGMLVVISSLTRRRWRVK